MMSEHAELKPVSPQERQAATTLAAARGVVREIERVKDKLTDPNLPAEERPYWKQQLFETSERLCNLMALALYQLSQEMSSGFHGAIKDGLDDLRGRLLDMGTNLMLERVGRIHDRAAKVLKGAPYPIGLAARLEETYAGLVGNMQVLGALQKLPVPERKLVDDTSRNIKALAQIESDIGILTPLDAPEVERYLRRDGA